MFRSSPDLAGSPPSQGKAFAVLVAAAALLGGAPGLIAVVAGPSLGKPLFTVLGVLWITMHAGCALIAWFAPWAAVRSGESAAVATLTGIVAFVFVPDGLLVLLPGCVLWVVVAAICGESSGSGLLDRMFEQLRRGWA